MWKIYVSKIDSESDSDITLFASEYETYTVKTYIPLNETDHVVVGYSPTSSLYPEYLGRWTGNYIFDKDGKKEKEIVYDIYMGHCNWYIWESINKKKDVC